jgi:hypothetical protein
MIMTKVQLAQHVRCIRAEFIEAAKQAPGIFFAPITGAVKELNACWKQLHSR